MDKHVSFDPTVDASASLECNSASSASKLRDSASDECSTSSSTEVPRTQALLELSVYYPLSARYPELCLVDGCVEGCDHKPNIDPNVPPIVQPLRRIPQPLEEQVCKKLEEIEST